MFSMLDVISCLEEKVATYTLVLAFLCSKLGNRNLDVHRHDLYTPSIVYEDFYIESYRPHIDSAFVGTIHTAKIV